MLSSLPNVTYTVKAQQNRLQLTFMLKNNGTDPSSAEMLAALQILLFLVS